MHPLDTIPTHQGSDQDGRLLRVEIRRGRERWSFSCGPEDRGTLLMEMLRLAEDPSVAFGAFDAAVVAHQLAGEPPKPEDRARRAQRAA